MECFDNDSDNEWKAARVNLFIWNRGFHYFQIEIPLPANHFISTPSQNYNGVNHGLIPKKNKNKWMNVSHLLAKPTGCTNKVRNASKTCLLTLKNIYKKKETNKKLYATKKMLVDERQLLLRKQQHFRIFFSTQSK